MTTLTIVQAASREIGLPVPTTVINNTNQTVVQMLGLLNSLGKELQQNYDWQALTKEGNFTAVATESQGALTTIASDYDRYCNGTMFNRTDNWEILGPINPQQWQHLLSTDTDASRHYFRIRGDTIIFHPVGTAGDSIYFEYISTNWCESSGGTGQTAFAADTDVSLIDENLLERGLIYRFLEAKGLDYAEPFRRYQLQLSNSMKRDGAKPKLDMGPRPPFDPRNVNVSDGSWNL